MDEKKDEPKNPIEKGGAPNRSCQQDWLKPQNVIDPKNQGTYAETEKEITETNDYTKSYHTISLISQVWISPSLENYCEIRCHDDSDSTHNQLDWPININRTRFL